MCGSELLRAVTVTFAGGPMKRKREDEDEAKEEIARAERDGMSAVGGVS